MNITSARLFVHASGPNHAHVHDRIGRPFTGLADALAALTRERHAHAARKPHRTRVWTAEFRFCDETEDVARFGHTLTLGTLSSTGETTFNTGFEQRHACAVGRHVWFTGHGPDAVAQALADIPTLEADRTVNQAVRAGARMTWVDLQTGALAHYTVQLTGLIYIEPAVLPAPVGQPALVAAGGGA